jgi:hypothetical protein
MNHYTWPDINSLFKSKTLAASSQRKGVIMDVLFIIHVD